VSQTKRIYVIKAKSGKKKIFVKAATRAQAGAVILRDYFDINVASHEELFAVIKDPSAEILDAAESPQVDIKEQIAAKTETSNV
jgi:hypothetical protein